MVDALVPKIEALYPGITNARWIAYRLIEGDYSIRQAILSGDVTALGGETARSTSIDKVEA
jgi:hypothetical protein